MRDLKKVLPIERAKMRVKLAFANEDQQAKMMVTLKEQADGQFLVDDHTENTCTLRIDPSLYREISNIIKGEKEFYSDVIIEIQDTNAVEHQEPI